MTRLAFAAIAAAVAIAAPVAAQAHDEFGPTFSGGAAPGFVIGEAVPHAYGRPDCSYYGPRAAAHAPGSCRSVVRVPHRLGRAGEGRGHAVTYFYPQPATNYRMW